MYLKIICQGAIVFSKEEITKEDLADVLQGNADVLINLSDMTNFRPDENKWLPIEPISPKPPVLDQPNEIPNAENKAI